PDRGRENRSPLGAPTSDSRVRCPPRTPSPARGFRPPRGRRHRVCVRSGGVRSFNRSRGNSTEQHHLVFGVQMRALQYLSAGMLLAASLAGAQTAADHVALGDKEYVAMNAPAALQHYEEAIKVDPRNYEALWKASRSAVDLGSYESNDKKREDYFKNAELYARRAVEVNPGDAEGHFNLARALGKNALTQSPRARIKYAKDVSDHALECLKISPKHAGCLHVMGMWNAEVMRLNGFTRMIAENFLGGKIFDSASWAEAKRYMEASVASE